ncbi:BMP family ABC transporter substrate-binding protein [Bacillaceae bacterium S4-13-58]
MTRKLIAPLFILLLLTACGQNESSHKIKAVGVLLEDTIDDQVWGQKGYQGIVKIQKKYDAKVYSKENVSTQRDVDEAVKEFSRKGVQLIFGHGSIYGSYFPWLNEQYPDIEFVYFNGSRTGDNLSSLSFQSHAMGFFGGMVAGSMTKTNDVAVIAAYEWQPEVEGFYQGVLYQNPEANVEITFVHDWNDVNTALALFETLEKKDVDVYYPAGDGFNIPIIEKVKETGDYAIGYVSDQIHLGVNTVLTSTVQHVEQLYLVATDLYVNNELHNGTRLSFDFQDDAVSLGEFSPIVPESVKEQVLQAVEDYKETGLLPYEK